MSDSQQPHGLQPTRLLCPWDFPGKSTGVGQAKANRVLPRECTGHTKYPLPTTQEKNYTQLLSLRSSTCKPQLPKAAHLEPVLHNKPQLPKAAHLEPVLHNKRSHCNETSRGHKEEELALSATRGSPCKATKTQHNQEINNILKRKT